MRGDDLVARWGGEEFLVFAPNVEGAELDQLAERVRLAMNQAPVIHYDQSFDLAVLEPVNLAGQRIASSFWGKAWCKNLESYMDFSNRLPRGRTYLRTGAVIEMSDTYKAATVDELLDIVLRSIPPKA